MPLSTNIRRDSSASTTYSVDTTSDYFSMSGENTPHTLSRSQSLACDLSCLHEEEVAVEEEEEEEKEDTSLEQGSLTLLPVKHLLDLEEELQALKRSTEQQ